MIKIKSNKIILKDKLFDGYIYIDKDKIVEVSKEEKAFDTFYDYTNLYVSPGFIDIHTHGGGGHPFINTTEKDVISAVNFHLSHGTTSILPTITAGKIDVMEDSLKKIIDAKKSDKAKANILGAH
ncbi:MAG: amidohydrolase family protein, partial [Bacilli bacterium]|nr:amidohydrolase family protein [Bacilli bacterium]